MLLCRVVVGAYWSGSRALYLRPSRAVSFPVLSRLSSSSSPSSPPEDENPSSTLASTTDATPSSALPSTPGSPPSSELPSVIKPPWQVSDLTRQEQIMYAEMGPNFVHRLPPEKKLTRSVLWRATKRDELAVHLEKRLGPDWYEIRKEVIRRKLEERITVSRQSYKKAPKLSKEDQDAQQRLSKQRYEELLLQVLEERRKQSSAQQHVELSPAPPTEEHPEVSSAPPTEEHPEVSTALPTKEHPQLSSAPPTKEHPEVSSAPPTEEHPEVSLAPPTKEHGEQSSAPQTEEHGKQSPALSGGN